MLEFYARHLNGVELNGSFYRTPPPSTLTGWAEAVPPSFRFCFKAHRGLTYSGERFDREGMAREVGGRLAELGPRLGPVLLQFPPTRLVDPGHLERILLALEVRAAVEFRHESWVRDDVYEVLRSHGAALVVTDQDKWPAAPRLDLASFGYYRLRRDYDSSALERWRRELLDECQGKEELHVYFRHDPEAPARAARLLDR